MERISIFVKDKLYTETVINYLDVLYFLIDEIKTPMHVGPLYTESIVVHGLVHQPLQGEVAEMLRLMSLRNWKHEEEIPPDERTIFLTFSKGYPIPEKEVIDFFTRLYGDLVEGVYMQDVQKDEQALYAKLVLRYPSAISIVLEGRTKAKFSINGKHVWARKYVYKSNKLPTAKPLT